MEGRAGRRVEGQTGGRIEGLCISGFNIFRASQYPIVETIVLVNYKQLNLETIFLLLKLPSYKISLICTLAIASNCTTITFFILELERLISDRKLKQQKI